MRYWALYSGGKDSGALVHYLRSRGELAGIISINTLTGSPELIDWLKKNSEVNIIPTPINYEYIVETYGFARPGSHSWYFRYLKERGIDIFRREIERETGEKITFASGVRKYESHRRSRNTMKRGEISHRKVETPLLDWTDEMVWAYINKHNISISPCYKTCHRALDCTCQAYGDTSERRILEIFEPDIVERNKRLEDRLGGRWSNNKLPNIRSKGQQILCECNQA